MSRLTWPDILISGAGISGLTQAIALSDGRWHITLLEREARLTEIGAGIQLAPNASRILCQLGLGPQLNAEGVEISRLRIKAGQGGRAIAEVPLGKVASERYGAPFLAIHRGILQKLLLNKIEEKANISLCLDREIVDCVHDKNGVTAMARCGQSHHGRGLIAADGLYSQLRNHVAPNEAPVYSGYTAYRCLVARHDLPDAINAPDITLWLSPRRHLVHYPIDNERINMVAIVRQAKPPEPRQPAVRLRPELFQDWSDTPLRMLEHGTDRWRQWPIYHLPFHGALARDHIALIGDAGHPMLPFLAQGAAMGIEDAAAIAWLLANNDADIRRALADYQTLRRQRVQRVMQEAQRNGWIYHCGGPVAAIRNFVLRRYRPVPLLARFDWLYAEPAIA